MENYKLLVVDDAFFIRNLIKKAISNKPTNDTFSISVIGEAKNAKEAISFCETDNPDIITVDYQMPPGENGLELIKELKVKYPNKMFLMISDDATIENDIKNLGCKFLTKPFQEKELWTNLDLLVLNQLKKNIKSKQENLDLKQDIKKEIDTEKAESVEENKKKENIQDDNVINKSDNTINNEPSKKKKKKKKKKHIQSFDDDLDFGFEVAGSLKKELPSKKISEDTKITKESHVEKSKNENIKVNKDFDKKELTNDNQHETKIKEDVEKKEKHQNKEHETVIEQKIEQDVEQKNLNIDDKDLDLDFESIIENDESIENPINKTVEKEILIDFRELIENVNDENDQNSDEKNQSHEVIKEKEDENEILDDDPEFEQDYISEKESQRIESSEIEHDKKDLEEDEPYYIDDEDDDVFTFYEEDESQYEDKNIDKFKNDSIEQQNIVDDTEELSEDEELEQLIKEASYSLDSEETVVHEKSSKSTLSLDRDDDEDLFIDIDEVKTDFQTDSTSDEKDFDEMLNDFEKSEEFEESQAKLKEEEAFDNALNNVDVETFSLDDLYDGDISLEESSSDNNSSDLSKNIEVNQNDEEIFELNNEEETNEIENEDEDFFLDDEESFENFDLNDDSYDNKSDSMQDAEFQSFDLESSYDDNIEENLNEDEFDEEEFEEDELEEDKLEENEQSNSIPKKMTDEDFESLFDLDDDADDNIPIMDTQTMPTDEIIKRSKGLYDQNEIKPPMGHKKQNKMKLKESRPDGTQIKQKESFFGRFFKKK